MIPTHEPSPICSSSWCRRYAPTVVLVVLGAAISVAVFFAAYSWERCSVDREFASLSEDRFHAIRNKVEDSANLLKFADNVFLVAPRANAPEFPDYLRSLTTVLETDLSRHPAVRTIIWMPRVSRGERAAYERAAQAVFNKTVQFNEPVSAAGAEPDREREEYFPSYLCVAASPNRDRSCRDLPRDTEKSEEMRQARDGGRTVASVPMRISPDSDDRLGYRLFHPLYRGEPKDVAEKRESILGFLCVDLDIGESVSRAFNDIPPIGIDVLISDVTNGANVAICQHTSRLQSPVDSDQEQSPRKELASNDTMDFFGRKLLIRCLATPAFCCGHIIWEPWVLLFGGLASTLAVASYRLGIALRDRAIERTVEARMAAVCRDFEKRQGKGDRHILP